MRKTILSAALALTALAAFSQSFSDLRPRWAKASVNPPAGANYFLVWGVGEAADETSATNAAWADALQKSLHELGAVGITQQDIDAVRVRGISAVASFNKMKRRALCSTEFIRDPSGAKGKVYLLVQVQRSVGGKDDFYEAKESSCSDPAFDKALAEYNSKSSGDYPFSPRVFVPGMAQLHKGSTAKGVFFIVGEAAMVGGIVAAESLRASYSSKANSTHDLASKKTYLNNAGSCKNMRNGLIAGAAALYVWNVVDGWVARGKKHATLMGNNTLNITPFASPYSGGVALTLNF
ncbi:MAG: hypothetical protein LBH84_02385 [Prevotellaceae bacterium]|jgi:hypothetical protein|nr:hypothetical protein [Prevotellaceae bacterium]